jgi:hypothetical protein
MRGRARPASTRYAAGPRGWRRRAFGLALLLAWLGVAGAARAADEIHWTITGPGAVAFDWRGAENSIRYGTTAAYGQTATATAPSPLPVSSSGPFWEVALGGLLADTVYHYSIGGGPDHTFRTAPARGSSNFAVCVAGDVGNATSFPRMGVMQGMIATLQPRFVLMVGDLTYGNILPAGRIDDHFNDVMPWSQDAAYMPAWGNHEWDKVTDDLRNYKGRFALPNAQASPHAPDSADVAGALPPYGEDWYWFDYGNARFISIPDPYTYGAGGPWAAWTSAAGALMDQAESDPAIAYIVTFGHRPSYCSGFYTPGDPELRADLDALGAAHRKYLLDLCGHSHNYERSLPR